MLGQVADEFGAVGRMLVPVGGKQWQVYMGFLVKAVKGESLRFGCMAHVGLVQQGVGEADVGVEFDASCWGHGGPLAC